MAERELFSVAWRGMMCERESCSLLCGEKNVRERGWRGKCETERELRGKCETAREKTDSVEREM